MFRSMLGSCLKGRDTEKVILVNGGLHQGSHLLSTFGWKDLQNQVAFFLISWHCPFAKVSFCSLSGCRGVFIWAGSGGMFGRLQIYRLCWTLFFTPSMILMVALIILKFLSFPDDSWVSLPCCGWWTHDSNWAWLGSISRLLSVRHLHLWKARKGRHARRLLHSFVWGC